MKNRFIFLSLLFLAFSVLAGEVWAPVSGYSSVDQTKAYNSFSFVLPADQYSSGETYEHETQVYNNAFADYDG